MVSQGFCTEAALLKGSYYSLVLLLVFMIVLVQEERADMNVQSDRGKALSWGSKEKHICSTWLWDRICRIWLSFEEGVQTGKDFLQFNQSVLSLGKETALRKDSLEKCQVWYSSLSPTLCPSAFFSACALSAHLCECFIALCLGMQHLICSWGFADSLTVFEAWRCAHCRARCHLQHVVVL